MTYFCDRLLEERRRLNLTQTDMSRVCGVALSTYHSYEKGLRAPDADSFGRLHAAGVDVYYLVAGSRSNGALTQQESLLLELFNRADDRARYAVLALLREYDSYGK